MNRDEYIMANIGDPVLVNGNAKESGTKANIVKFHNDRTGDGMYHGKIRVRFEDGSEKTYSHYFLTVFKKDMVEKKNTAFLNYEFGGMTSLRAFILLAHRQ
jgi:hypothetical protein